MFLHIKDAEYLEGYKVEVAFSNGQQGIADLSEALSGPVFEPLKNQAMFSSFIVDNELETLVWPNGADLAPEYIFFQAFKNDSALQEQFRKWGYIS
ncbi:MAG: Protein of unknown function (DUF2442) [Candidatus Electronema aureum]|uniref:DUF2442 domain-containing protein n=1 Tax=Candidatus Electronema aureum TaxID=2005002 RepID=A0A521G2X5_9BACT|nr:MAG: Protein of unknown function (DUF2442) [Candidatus Electronema aureum]